MGQSHKTGLCTHANYSHLQNSRGRPDAREQQSGSLAIIATDQRARIISGSRQNNIISSGVVAQVAAMTLGIAGEQQRKSET